MQNIGFTGTQTGMTPAQRAALAEVLTTIAADEGGITLHHGDCIGADKQAHEIVGPLPNCMIHIHPPEKDAKRAFCHNLWPTEKADLHIHAPKDYRRRNQDIVDACPILFAAPRLPEDDPRSKRSGTWMTIRMALKAKRWVVLFWPDGETDSNIDPRTVR